ncbi:MAG: hypothetical protein RR101_11510, partial [Burkholderiaceae bacterium]
MQKDDLRRQKDERATYHHRDQGHAGDHRVDRHDVAHRLAQIAVDSPPEPHRSDDRAKIVVEQDHGGGFACDLGA